MANVFFGYLDISEKHRCKRCYGTGYILSESCDDCIDCQDKCPICDGSGKTPDAKNSSHSQT